MKKLLLLLSILCIFLCGCLATPNEEFVKGIDGLAKQILPIYDKAITNDPSLNQEDKEIRLQTSAQMRKMIDVAKQQMKKGD